MTTYAERPTAAACEIIPYTTATRMASVYASATGRLNELLREVSEQVKLLQSTFDDEWGFRLEIEHDRRNIDITDKGIGELNDKFNRAAWRALIQKLGIMKLMSAKRRDGLLKQLAGEKPSYDQDPEPLPEISEKTIMEVLMGMVQSGEEFMGEAIREEYDYWKIDPQWRENYKRNSTFKLNRKIIRPHVVERGYGGARYHVQYRDVGHVTAMDNIFHLLDGKGFPREHEGPLCAAIKTAEDGTGETNYFRFKCHKNGNLHLEFKRLDLLDQFNAVAGRNRLGATS